MARTASSPAAVRSAAARRSVVTRSNALRASGRLMVMVRTAPSCSIQIVCSMMVIMVSAAFECGGALFQEGRHPLTAVLRREQQIERSSLVLESGFERRVECLQDGILGK